MNRQLTYLVICLVFLSPAAFGAKWETLTGEELEAAFSDKTLIGQNFVTYYDGNGVVKGSWGGGRYTGKYYFKDDGLYCVTWDDWEKGKKEGCWSVAKKKNKIKVIPASGRADKKITTTSKDGNVKKL